MPNVVRMLQITDLNSMYLGDGRRFFSIENLHHQGPSKSFVSSLSQTLRLKYDIWGSFPGVEVAEKFHFTIVTSKKLHEQIKHFLKKEKECFSSDQNINLKLDSVMVIICYKIQDRNH